MLRIGSVVLGVEDLRTSIRFWEAALDYTLRREPADDTWAILIPRSGEGGQLALMKSVTPSQDRPRLHLDLYADDQETEISRLISLGAHRVEWDSYGADADFVVLADPDGNRFCVIEAPAAPLEP
jgi:predicted enzyme related to lactoylglutathione lyase